MKPFAINWAILLALASVPAQAATLTKVVAVLWTDPGILRANVDGSFAEQLIAGGDPEDVGLDQAGNRMFWTNSEGLWASDLDGVGATKLVSGSFNRLSVYGDDDLILFSSQAAGNEAIHSARLDGSNHHVVLTAAGSIGDVAADPSRGYIFWSEPVHDRILRANLDGTSSTVIVDDIDSANNAQGLNPDIENNQLYWFDIVDDTIHRADAIAFNSVEAVFDIPAASPGSAIRDLKIDFANNEMYWINVGLETIDRVNIDGTNLNALFSIVDTGFDDRGIALEVSVIPEPSTIALASLGLVGLVVALGLRCAGRRILHANRCRFLLPGQADLRT